MEDNNINQVKNTLREHFKKINEVSPVLGGVLETLVDEVCEMESLKVKMPQDCSYRNQKESFNIAEQYQKREKTQEQAKKTSEPMNQEFSELNLENGFEFFKNLGKEFRIDLDEDKDDRYDEISTKDISTILSDMENDHLRKENELLIQEIRRLQKDLDKANERLDSSDRFIKDTFSKILIIR